MGYQPGQSGNPNGRKPGTRNKRTQEIFDLLETRGDKDPIDFLSDYIRNGKDEALRIQAASIVAPYKHSKCGSTVPLRYIPEPLDIPRATSIQRQQITSRIFLNSRPKANWTWTLQILL
jgi:hypothetical protein